jgi:hypothetical protein
MKALSVKQPYASWIADGSKTIETRKWATKYRGPLLICSSARTDEETINAAYSSLIRLGGRMGNFSSADYGMALCTVDLAGCRPMTKGDERSARCEFYEGAFSWELRNLQRVKPFPVKGMLGLFRVNLP